MPREERENILLLVVGLGFLALADIGFFVLVVRETVGISAINILWPVGFFALALGAVRPAPRDLEPEPVREPSQGLVPLTVAAGVLTLSLTVVSRGVEPSTGVLATLLVGLVFARLAASRLERRRVRTIAKHVGES